MLEKTGTILLKVRILNGSTRGEKIRNTSWEESINGMSAEKASECIDSVNSEMNDE